MLAYIARRLASTVLVMGIVAVFVFLLLHLSPGDPAAIIAGDNASGEQIAGIRKQLGLDDALPVQFYRWLVFLTNTVQTTMLRMFYPERYGSDDVGEVAAADAARQFALLDRTLDGREWLVGEHRTAADLFLFMLTRGGRRLSPPAWELPHLRAHFARTSERPGVRRMIAEQDLDLPEWAG